MKKYTKQKHLFKGISNKKVEVEAVITDIQQTPVPEIRADGVLKVDGLYIYRMENFGFRLVPMEG